MFQVVPVLPEATTGKLRFEFQKQSYTLKDGKFEAPSFPDKLPIEASTLKRKEPCTLNPEP